MQKHKWWSTKKKCWQQCSELQNKQTFTTWYSGCISYQELNSMEHSGTSPRSRLGSLLSETISTLLSKDMLGDALTNTILDQNHRPFLFGDVQFFHLRGWSEDSLCCCDLNERRECNHSKTVGDTKQGSGQYVGGQSCYSEEPQHDWETGGKVMRVRTNANFGTWDGLTSHNSTLGRTNTDIVSCFGLLRKESWLNTGMGATEGHRDG